MKKALIFTAGATVGTITGAAAVTYLAVCGASLPAFCWYLAGLVLGKNAQVDHFQQEVENERMRMKHRTNEDLLAYRQR